MYRCKYCGKSFSYNVIKIHESWCKDNNKQEETTEEKIEETEGIEEIKIDRKKINKKLKKLGFDGDLRTLTDEEALETLKKLEK